MIKWLVLALRTIFIKLKEKNVYSLCLYHIKIPYKTIVCE